jgi:hypothetical protein
MVITDPATQALVSSSEARPASGAVRDSEVYLIAIDGPRIAAGVKYVAGISIH